MGWCKVNFLIAATSLFLIVNSQDGHNVYIDINGSKESVVYSGEFEIIEHKAILEENDNKNYYVDWLKIRVFDDIDLWIIYNYSDDFSVRWRR